MNGRRPRTFERRRQINVQRSFFQIVTAAPQQFLMRSAAAAPKTGPTNRSPTFLPSLSWHHRDRMDDRQSRRHA